MLYKINTQINNNKIVARDVVDLTSGEVLDFASFFQNINGKVYVTNLSLGYIDIVKYLLDNGFVNVWKAENIGEFSFAYKNGDCLNIQIMTTNGRLIIMNFAKKFLQDFEEIGIDNALKLIKYAEETGRTATAIGVDAFNDFLAKSFKIHGRTVSANAVRNFYRKELPEINDPILESAKQHTSGYQIAHSGYYYNLHSYDIRASYASQLLNDLPKGQLHEFAKLEDVPTTYFYIVKICYYDIRIKEGCIDFLQADGKNVKTFVLTKHLHALFEHNYKYTLCAVKRVVAFKTRHNFAHAFVQVNVLEGRKEGTEPCIAKYNKGMANAFVGYCGKNTTTTRSRIVNDTNGWRIDYNNEESEPIYLPIYLYVTGKAKAEFIMTLQKIGLKHVIYANTDGLLTDIPINLKWLNFGRNNTIGLYKDKGVFEEIFIECINGYCGRMQDGTIDNTISGMRTVSKLSAQEYQTGHFDYYFHELQQDGHIHKVIVHK